MNKHLVFLFVFSLCTLLHPSHAVDIAVTNPDGSSVHFDVEIADTDAKRKRGLKGRQHLPDHKGMIFLYDKARSISMWMKNTPVPLDMLFFNESGKVLRVVENVRPFSTNVIGPVADTFTVLEIPAGSCKKHRIQEGSFLETRPEPSE